MFKCAIEKVYAVNTRLFINYCSVAFFTLQMIVVLCSFLGLTYAEMYLCEHSIKNEKNR